MWVRLVVPTSRSSAPEAAMMSGMRKAVADFDQLAAADDRFAAARQFVQRQQHRGGVVVHGDSGSPGQTFQESGNVRVALAAASANEIVFEIGITFERRESARWARGRDWCAESRRSH